VGVIDKIFFIRKPDEKVKKTRVRTRTSSVQLVVIEIDCRLETGEADIIIFVPNSPQKINTPNRGSVCKIHGLSYAPDTSL